MGYGTNGLTFSTLRSANRARLPEFKNRHGGKAHSKADGSDWSPAMWLMALFGELGELAEVRLLAETGAIDRDDYRQRMADELADVVTYLDLFAQRCMDEVALPILRDDDSPAQTLMVLIAQLGDFANTRKKYARGDLSREEYRLRMLPQLARAADTFRALAEEESGEGTPATGHPGDIVIRADESGIDLGEATIAKFNAVSERVGSRVWVDAEDWHLRGERRHGALGMNEDES